MPRESEELTGRVRLRLDSSVRKLPKLVLQVERKYLHTDNIGGQINTEWVRDWRDAVVGDLTITKLFEIENLVKK